MSEGMILFASKPFLKDQLLVTELKFASNLFSSFVNTWSHVMDVKDHTQQIQYFTQSKEFMILLPSPAYEHTSIGLPDVYSTNSLRGTDI